MHGCVKSSQVNANELGGDRADAPLITAERRELTQQRRQLGLGTMKRNSAAFGKRFEEMGVKPRCEGGRCVRQRDGQELLRNAGV